MNMKADPWSEVITPSWRWRSGSTQHMQNYEHVKKYDSRQERKIIHEIRELVDPTPETVLKSGDTLATFALSYVLSHHLRRSNTGKKHQSSSS